MSALRDALDGAAEAERAGALALLFDRLARAGWHREALDVAERLRLEDADPAKGASRALRALAGAVMHNDEEGFPWTEAFDANGRKA